jgi:hypothetical protein
LESLMSPPVMVGRDRKRSGYYKHSPGLWNLPLRLPPIV